MAVHFSPLKFASFLVLVLFMASSNSSAARPDKSVVDLAATNDLFGDVCSGTLNPSLCLQVIRTIPGAAKVSDLKSLAQITITFAHSNAADTLKYVQSLAGSATNPRLKEDYKSCAENYDNALGDLTDAQNYFKSGDYPSVATMATSGMTEVEDCRDDFKSPPTTDPSQLPKKNQYFDTLCLIILRIANKL